jgi:NAD(P)H-dependent flavin oxidoreductase YrpB (nitropropane dioxygenase family)
MMKTRLSEAFGLEYPIFAFSRSPAVVAAVSKAGGMGVLGAVASTLDQLKADLDYVEAHAGGKPYGVDVVMPASLVEGATDQAGYEKLIPERHKAFVEDLLRRYEVPPLPPGDAAWHSLLAWTEAQTRPQIDVALSYPIKLLANALGPPPRDVVERAHKHGVKVAALTGAVDHALKQVDNGVDIVVAVGTEAGGHTGDVSTMVLVPEVVDAVAPRPVLAGGGIGSGRQIAAALALGAEGVWTGSIWLTSAESDLIPVLKDKLLRATSSDTVRARALTGKPARQLKTAWSEEWSKPENPAPLQMPLHFMLTAEATTRIFKAASTGTASPRALELLTSPVGQIVGKMNSVRPVAEIMASLVSEYEAAVARLGGLR